MQTTPSWLTQEFLAKCLLQKCGPVKIKGSVSEAAVPAGSNFTSELYRIKVTYSGNNNDNMETISIIVKVEPTQAQLDILIKEMRLFRKEITMYTEVLSKMKTLLKIEKMFYPDCLLGINEPEGKSYLVLEDLIQTGFKVHSISPGLDLDHCKLVMQSLAQFHAAGMILVREKPSLKDLYNTGIFYGPTEEWVIRGLDSLHRLCENTPDLRKYAEKTRKFKDYVSENVEGLIFDEEGFKVLVHGDAWTNNMLFNYGSNGAPDSVKMIDYQIVNYGNPHQDLHYFLAICPDDQVRKEHFTTLLDFYFDHFMNTLKKLNYTDPVPDKQEFYKNHSQYAFYGVISAVTAAPIVYGSLERKHDAGYHSFMAPGEEKGSFRHHCFYRPHFLSYITQELYHFDSLGAFN